MPRVAILITLLLVGAGAAVMYGGWRWRAATDGLHARLHAARIATAAPTYDPRDLDSLPPVVQRYFHAVLRPGQPLVAVARFTHAGTFNLGEQSPDWRAFSSTQIVTPRRPGFVWDARVRMAPGVNVLVHDAYVAGEGLLRAKVLGLMTVAEVHGTPEAAAGELMRYLAEAMWYPTALLPSEGIQWNAIDNTSARATLTDGETTVSLDFRFRPDGLIDSTYAAARPRTIGGAVVRAPWTGRGWRYDLQHGMRIPLEAEVAWLDPAGAYPYWRGRITRIDYEYAKD